MTPEELGFIGRRLDVVGGIGRQLVDDQKIPCALVQIARDGEVVYRNRYGHADIERNRLVSEDTIFRIHSMTKAVTSVALMQLYERGLVLLEDPIEKYIPAFADMTVWSGGTAEQPETRPAARSITVKDLLCHTSGLTYGFRHQSPVDELYRNNSLSDLSVPDYDLAEMCERLGDLPLLFEPGERWHYSMSTDVLGHLVEVIADQPLSTYIREFITDPLHMFDTGFSVPVDHAGRLAACYFAGPDGMQLADDPATSHLLTEPRFESGGGGLLSTIGDYQQFLSMLQADGERNGHRIIGRRTLAYMTTNHLPGGIDLNQAGQTLWAPEHMAGRGFGLGFGVITDPAAHNAIASVGDYGWGGMASTLYWVDPVERLTVLFMTQLMPSSSYPIRRLLRSAVYQALL